VPLAHPRRPRHLARTTPPATQATTPVRRFRGRRHRTARGPRPGHPGRGGAARRLAIGLLCTVIAALGAVLGAAWYVTGRLIAITHVQDSYQLRVLASDAKSRVVVLARGPDATEPGTFRLAWPGGHAVVGGVLSATRQSVTRRLFTASGHLEVGEHVGIEPSLYTGDPLSALHLHFSTVPVPTTLGAMPAWYVPGRRSTWVILIHGLGGSRADTLPPMRTLHALGYPMLAITYRNDLGAPHARDDRSHLGASEWHDVVAAVGYAVGHHATGVVLYGYSLGGSMALIAARDPAIRPYIRAVVLDSPLLDWLATIDYAARRDRIPQAFTALTETLLAWRAHIDFAQFDQLDHENELTAPVLLFQGSSDTVVPPDLAAKFARNRPGLVTYVPVAGADHVSAIDTDPSAYKAALRRFLAAWP
jgi:pimeloyl-ACP methyl ester carboxylesterase